MKSILIKKYYVYVFVKTNTGENIIEKRKLYFNLFAILYMRRRRKKLAVKSHRSKWVHDISSRGKDLQSFTDWSVNWSLKTENFISGCWIFLFYLLFIFLIINISHFLHEQFQRNFVLGCLNVILFKSILKSFLRKEISG